MNILVMGDYPEAGEGHGVFTLGAPKIVFPEPQYERVKTKIIYRN